MEKIVYLFTTDISPRLGIKTSRTRASVSRDSVFADGVASTWLSKDQTLIYVCKNEKKQETHKKISKVPFFKSLPCWFVLKHPGPGNPDSSAVIGPHKFKVLRNNQAFRDMLSKHFLEK
jgi:hypothetical protein